MQRSFQNTVKNMVCIFLPRATDLLSNCYKALVCCVFAIVVCLY